MRGRVGLPFVRCDLDRKAPYIFPLSASLAPAYGMALKPHALLCCSTPTQPGAASGATTGLGLSAFDCQEKFSILVISE